MITVTDAAWPHGHPTGRAHIRLLWRTAENGAGPVLWLEGTHVDFRAAGRVDARAYDEAILAHALALACEMRAPLSVEAGGTSAQALEAVAGARGCPGSAAVATEALILRPSNGVVEASDYLSDRHDWVQMAEEQTQPLRRLVFTPDAAGGPHAKVEL